MRSDEWLEFLAVQWRALVEHNESDLSTGAIAVRRALLTMQRYEQLPGQRFGKRPADAPWLDVPIPRPVTDPDLDAPDGAVVDGYERVGDTWQPLTAPPGAGDEGA